MKMNDTSFEHLYINMPNNLSEYCSDFIAKKEIYKDYSCFDFAYAFMSRDLLRKCLAISNIPINNLLMSLIGRELPDFLNYVDITIETCKLLHEHGCSMVQLLDVGYYANNYECITYIINRMTALELADMINNKTHLCFRLINILIIDAVYVLHDPVLIHLLNNSIHKYIFCDYNMTVALRCYNIIKYLTIEQGNAVAKQHNDAYSQKICQNNSQILKNKIKIEQDLFNSLLTKHFTLYKSNTQETP
jgi:hypothetical protein